MERKLSSFVKGSTAGSRPSAVSEQAGKAVASPRKTGSNAGSSPSPSVPAKQGASAGAWSGEFAVREWVGARSSARTAAARRQCGSHATSLASHAGLLLAYTLSSAGSLGDVSVRIEQPTAKPSADAAPEEPERERPDSRPSMRALPRSAKLSSNHTAQRKEDGGRGRKGGEGDLRR